MKSLKNLLIPAIVIVVLLIGTILWFKLKPEDADSTSTSEQTHIDVLTVDLTTVDNVTVDRKSGDQLKFVSSFDSQGVQSWTYASVDAKDGVSYSQSSMESYLSIMSSYSASSQVTDATDLSEYGLDDPSYTITINCIDGTSHVVYIGNKTYDEQDCYFMVDDSTQVYVTAVIKCVYGDYTSIDFLDTQLLNIDYSQIDTLEFSRASDGIDLVTNCTINDETGDPQYFVTEPYNIQTSAYFENLAEYIATLEITSYLDIPDDQLSDYGLDNPEYAFIFTMDSGDKIEINLSGDMGGFYYGTCTGVDNYFKVSNQQIQGLETPILTLLSSYVNYVSASNVKNIDVTYGSESFEFDIDTEETISSDDATVTLNGRNAIISDSSGRTYCAVLFESLACIQIGGIDLEATPSGNSAMTISYLMKNGDSKEVSLIERDNESYYVMIDGEYSGFFIYAEEIFNDGGTDTYSYGVWAAYELLSTAIDNSIGGVYDIPAEN